MRRLAFLAGTILLAACQQPTDAPADEASPAVAAPTPTVAASTLSLEPLQDDDGRVVTDNMSNVGGCSFHDRDGRMLLSVGIPDNYGLAEGAGGPAIGVARPNGERTQLTAARADAAYVESGPQLTGGDFTLTVERASGEGKAMDMEQVQYPANLIVSDGSGDTRTYTLGGWRCGV